MLTSRCARQERLLGWLAAGGAELSRVALHQAGDGSRAVRARRAIRAGNRVLAVPRNLLITHELAVASPIGRRITASGVELENPQTYLAAFLLAERRAASSPWRPYLDALPASYPNQPINFAPHELAMLCGSSALRAIAAQRAALEGEHRALCANLPEWGTVSLDDFIWARLSVLTRVFSIELDGVATEALVPMADMLNHEDSGETEWGYHRARAAFVIRATRPFQCGEEVHDSYGPKPNRRFFVNYGFCVAGNPHDEAELRFAPGLCHDVPARRDDPRVGQMLSLLRLRHAGASLRGLIPAGGQGGDQVPALTAQNELQVMEAVGAAARDGLARFDTSLAQDRALLAGELAPRARLCIAMRAGEKQVLGAFVEMAETVSPLLRLSRPAFSRAARARLAGSPMVRDHLVSLLARLHDA